MNANEDYEVVAIEEETGNAAKVVVQVHKERKLDKIDIEREIDGEHSNKEIDQSLRQLISQKRQFVSNLAYLKNTSNEAKTQKAIELEKEIETFMKNDTNL